MPHAILRALRHRSTPTLLPSTSTSTQELPSSHLSIPSIFITVPDEEGAHHWCALAGTVAPLHQSRASGYHQPALDAPLPDFAALEETISKLKRAGETPKFQRPGRSDQVVLPKKKYSAGQGISHQQYNTQPAMGKRPRPKRPQTSPIPIVRRERFQAEDEDSNQDYFGASVSDVQMMADAQDPRVSAEAQSGRFTPTKVFRSLSKKSARRPSPVFTSISYESVVPQPFSAPAETGSFASARQQEQKPSKKRSSLGWLFSKRASVPAPLPEEALETVAEFEGHRAETIYEQTMDYYSMPDAEEPMSPVDTHESDLDKPLPPIPAVFAQSSSEVSVSETMSPAASTTSSELSAAELQINDGVQVQVIISPNDRYTPIELPSADYQLPPEAPIFTPAPVEKEKKIKRKFSLKRLRERFLSNAGQDVPPVPAVPAVPTLPTNVQTFPIDSQFTASTTTSRADGTFPTSNSIDSVSSKATASLEETVIAETPSARVTLDEDSNISTSSDDSSSTPDSSPPETPDAVSDGPVFELLQNGEANRKVLVADGYASQVEVGIVEPIGTGITRSTGMRRQLDSLMFAEMNY